MMITEKVKKVMVIEIGETTKRGIPHKLNKKIMKIMKKKNITTKKRTMKKKTTTQTRTTKKRTTKKIIYEWPCDNALRSNMVTPHLLGLPTGFNTHIFVLLFTIYYDIRSHIISL